MWLNPTNPYSSLIMWQLEKKDYLLLDPDSGLIRLRLLSRSSVNIWSDSFSKSSQLPRSKD